MKFHSKYLDKLSGGNSQILVFDCEFWHVLHNGENVETLPKSPLFFIPREIGGFLLIKNETQWDLNNEFFVTLKSPLKDVSFPISHYATVTPSTGYKLDELENKLNIPWGESFYSKLNTSQKKILKEGIHTYHEDSNIKKHHEPLSWISKFMKIYAKSTIVVKGTGDITSLKNICSIKGYEYLEPAKIINIANWNSESIRICGSAKLENTFECIKKNLSRDITQFLDHIPLGRPHDPASDAAMTFIIALYVVSQM